MDYSVWCETLNKYIEFSSEILSSDIELFNLTSIMEQYLEQHGVNQNITTWLNKNIDLLHIIDHIVTGDDLNDDSNLLSISDGTILKIDKYWYVNMNVLVEYLAKIDMMFMHEFLAQVMSDRVTKITDSSDTEIYTETETEIESDNE